MPKLDGRRCWRVEFPDGEIVMLRQLSAVRASLAAYLAPGVVPRLTRLEPGYYYRVITWNWTGRRRAGLVLVTRTTAARAERELVNEPLPLEGPELILSDGKLIRGL